MQNFWIIDGSSLVHREYYASIPLEMKYARTPEQKEAEEFRIPQVNGVYTNALDGFFTQLEAILTFQKPDYLAVCFDKSRDTTFRRELYSEYKAQRQPSPKSLKQQMQKAMDLCKSLGIPTFYSDEYEADDYAGTLAKKFASPDVKVHLLTTDRDYLQLLDDNIVCHMMVTNKEKMDKLVETYGEKKGPSGTYEYDTEMCVSELGVLPSQITDWKGISGDVSDNMPGIKGVSDKTVVPLLQKYGSVEGIYNYLENHSDEEAKQEWKSLGIARPPVAAVRGGEQEAKFFKSLATIKTDIPLDMNLIEFSRLPGNEMFTNLANEYELANLDMLMTKIYEYQRNMKIKAIRDGVEDVEHRSFDEAPDKEEDVPENPAVSNSDMEMEEDAEEYGEDFDMWA